jgi:hypothetical protein
MIARILAAARSRIGRFLEACRCWRERRRLRRAIRSWIAASGEGPQ